VHFLRHVVLVLGGFFLLAFGGFTALFWLVASRMGLIHLADPGAPHLGAASLLVVVVVGGVALVTVGRAVRRTAAPIGDVMEAAGRVAEGDYGARVAERGPHEVRVLARSFNAMTARLQESDGERRAFLADVVHELRTPLTVIQGNLEGLIDGIYPRDDAHLLPILEETRLLARLIDDLRTLSLMEAGALPLHRQPTDPGALAAETAASFRPQADAAGVTITAVIGHDVPVIDVDPSRIRQVLENLIANALAHTPRGGAIEVACGVEPGGGAPRRVSFAVRDTGAGIAPEDLPHVFDRFFKGPESRGTGLGLAIARDLVAAHGGQMTVKSMVGQGTTVTVALPTEHSSSVVWSAPT